MTINRHNYEEFIILYLDNELSSGDRRQVEAFVQQHPDIGEELQMLQQTRLDIDPSIVFEGKEILMKSASLGFINSDNYDEYLVQYIDNELNAEQKAAVEAYADNNPAVRSELELLLKTKLQPEASITFINKESLYRREEAPVRRIVPIGWWRIAAAVLLLIALTIGGFTFFKNNRTPGKDIAGTKDTQKSATPVIVNEKKEPVGEQPTLATTNSDQSVKEEVIKQKDNQAAFAKKTTNTTKAIKKSIDENTPVMAKQNTINPNNLPDGIHNPNMFGVQKNDAVLADLNVSGLTKLKENTSQLPVTSATTQSFIQAKNTLPPDEGNGGVAMNEPEKKTKFRGLLRTITRTFEKTTNIKATDDQDRLLVAGLAIRL
jgi:hypothetical protein